MARTIVHTGRKIQVAIDVSPGPRGGTVQRDVVLHPGAVAILPLTDDGRVCLLRNHRFILDEVLWELKMADLKKSGLLDMYRGGETFADLGGLDNLKQFCLQALRSSSRRARARGLLLLGVPGTGKSAFAPSRTPSMSG